MAPGSGVLGEGQLAPPHQLGGLGERCELPSWVRAKPRPVVILVLFEPPRTHLETAMFSLETNNLEAYLLSLAEYGTYVNVLTLHNLLNVQKLICRTIATYQKKQR